jgi:hypothetical protein
MRNDCALPSNPVGGVVLLGECVELLLGDVTERRMTQIVRERGRLDHFRLNSPERLQRGGVRLGQQLLREPPRDLCDLQRVRQPVVKYISLRRTNNLGYAAQPLECGRVKEAVSILLKGTAGAGTLRHPVVSICPCGKHGAHPATALSSRS